MRRSTDGDFIHANVDIDLIIDEEAEVGSLDKPVEMFHIVEHFCLGQCCVKNCKCIFNIFNSDGFFREKAPADIWARLDGAAGMADPRARPDHVQLRQERLQLVLWRRPDHHRLLRPDREPQAQVSASEERRPR